MRKIGLFVLTAVVAAPMVAPAQEYNQRVLKAMPSKYQAPLCSLKGGDFRTSSAGLYLKSGVEDSDPVKRESLLNKGLAVVTEAITKSGQEKSAAAWYYLGRIDLNLGDLVGADSAFTRAVALQPDCAEDVKGYRQLAWITLMTPAAEFVRQNNSDSAMALFHQAAIISREFPQGFYNQGVLFANAGESDSAAVYFKLAQEKAAREERFSKERNAATFNLAAVLQRAERHAEAAAELKRYLQWEPNDIEAKKALIQSLRATGATAEASAIEQQMLAAGATAGTLTNEDLASIGVSLFNQKKFAEAAEAFEKVVIAAPSDRIALANLANTYLAMKAGDKLVPVALKLIAMEPLNESNLKYLGEGYRLTNKQDDLIKVVTKLIHLPTSVEAVQFQRKKEGATLTGQAVGRQATDDAGKPLPATAITIVVEFTDAAGAVVSLEEVSIPALQPGAKHDWKAEGKGDGIAAWRYHAK
ncbi:MAG: tetratricopeptide repeat protein [Gemmatimonadota bacterium]